MVYQILPIKNRFEKLVKIVIFRYVKLGNIPAPQSEIAENIIPQKFQIPLAFRTVQHSDGGPIFSDDVWFFGKIMFKIARGVVASRGDDGIEIFQLSFREFNQILKSRIDRKSVV